MFTPKKIKFFSQTLYISTQHRVCSKRKRAQRKIGFFQLTHDRHNCNLSKRKCIPGFSNTMRCDTRSRTRNNCAIFSIQFLKKLITFSIRRVRIDIIASNTTENFVTLNGEKILFWFKTICAWNGVVAAECSVAVHERNGERKKCH